MYQKAALLSMLPDAEVEAMGQNAEDLFRWVKGDCPACTTPNFENAVSFIAVIHWCGSTDRWMAFASGLLESRSQQRSLLQRRPRDASPHPPQNQSSLHWWVPRPPNMNCYTSIQNQSSLHWWAPDPLIWTLIPLIESNCDLIKPCVIPGNDVCVERLHNSRKETRADIQHIVHHKEGRGPTRKFCKSVNTYILLMRCFQLNQNKCHHFKSLKLCLTVWLCTGQSDHHVDDQCVVQLLKGLCLRQLGSLDEAEGCFNHVISRWDWGDWCHTSRNTTNLTRYRSSHAYNPS